MSVNKVLILGFLGADPETKTLDTGKTVSKLRVATSKKWKDKEGKAQEKTEWHQVSVWGPMAATCDKYLKKGSQVFIEGELTTKMYEKDGEKKYSTEITANNVQFIGGKSEGTKAKSADVVDQGFDASESLPF
jgi:single-strand DNA-binding protein